MKILKLIFFSSFIFIFLFLLFNFTFGQASIQEEVSNRERQIQELELQKEEYQKQIDEKQKESKTLEGEIFILDTQIKQIQVEIRALDLVIQRTGLEINLTEEQIEEALAKIDRIKKILAEFIRLVYQSDQENLLAILLKNRDISDFFNNVENIRASQEKAQITITELKDLKIELEQKQEELEQRRTEHIGLKNIQEFEKNQVDLKKSERSNLFKITRGEERRFQELAAKTEQDIQRLRSQIRFLLEQGITLEEAVEFGRLAAERVGIRPAFLLAILDVESGIGRNVGSGNWLDDMYNCYLRLGKLSRAEAERSAFFAIIGKLGLDPNSVKVSAAPSYGCGGAMGPAQFIPSTWLLYEPEVARLTGHNPPNPWSIEDSFMAAAIYLANAGAGNQTPAAEIRAANIYLSGKANCRQSICRYYSNLVLQKAAEIEKEL